MDLLDWITAVLAGVAVVAALANPIGRDKGKQDQKLDKHER